MPMHIYIGIDGSGGDGMEEEKEDPFRILCVFMKI
jgi:hypothetical protein